MTGKEPPQLKKRQIHTILKALSPKRMVNSSKKGCRSVPRGISPEGVAYITQYLNNHLESIVKALEEALEEINNNPNSYYIQHRYDLLVVKRAISKLEGDTN